MSTRRSARNADRTDDATRRGAGHGAAHGGDDPAAAPPIRARRHSSRIGETFPGLVGWTSLSTLIPGIGLLRTRFRTLGWILLLGFILTIVGILAFVLIEGPVKALGIVVSNPTLLNILAVAAALFGLIWIGAMIASHMGLRKGNKYTGWQNGMAGVLVVSLALIIGVPFGIGSAFARVQSDTVAALFGTDGGKVQDAKDLWADKPHINIFLMGRDDGADRTGTRPDTMLVASIDTRTGNTALISVPRNLAFPIFPNDSPLAERWPDGFRPTGDSSVDLINSVWQWAESEPDAVGPTNGLEAGMVASMQAVEGSLGVSLDYWASVDMDGFKDVVDAIGGVDIDVERPIPMGGGKSLSGVPNRIFGWIDPGQQTLTGDKALWYVRSREGSDNYDRMCRQQRMLKTTIDQIDPQSLAMAYPKLANSATKNIETSIKQNEIPAFIELALSMQKGSITSVQINNKVTPTYNPDFDHLHEWIDKEVKDAMEGPKEPAPKKSSAPKTESTPTPTETEEPAPGEANAEGRCYPKGYKPGDPVAGYPGPGAQG